MSQSRHELETGVPDHRLDFLSGGGEMGARMRALDWSKTALGPPERWPQSLKTIVRVMLDSRYAMWMLWGSELTFFCNDAYLPTVGIKRDWVLGARSDKVWEEIWSDIGPRIDHVLKSGQATWDEGLLLFLERSGFPEETYHTFSYSPVYDDASRVAGMLCVVTEVTERVIGERRLRVLRDLAAQAVGVESVADSCERVVEVLSEYPLDLPFAVLYLMEPDRRSARRAALTGSLPDGVAPNVLLEHSDVWPVADLLRTEHRQLVGDLPKRGIAITAGPWPDLIERAMLLPIKSAGQEGIAGFVIVGASPRRALDASYEDFLELVAGQIASALADAQAYESERRRAEALAELDRAKTAFFSNVSHEFRTPLTLMLSPVEETLADAEVPERARERLNLVHRNALRLQKLVNALLDFSRIEAGRVQASYEPTDLATLTRDLASTFRSAIERAGLKYIVQCEPLSEPIYVDPEMWEKVVLNLLSNAFKHTLEGEIRVCLSQVGEEVKLEVIDSGVGIPEESLPHLFERFYRVPHARGRTQEGTGIGLALVQELVHLHGGDIHVASESGRGSKFTVSIPSGRGHLPASRIATDRAASSAAHSEAYIEEALRWLPQVSESGVFERALLPSGAANEQEGVAPSVRRAATILLADDNADMREYMRKLLQIRFQVVTAEDGEEALALARRGGIDLVLSDVMMPRVDGFGLLRELRADTRTRSLPVILVSARAGEEARVEGLDAGADDYLVKPFSARELIARVSSHLKLARIRREASEALREGQERLELALTAARMLAWRWDPVRDEIAVSGDIAGLYGLPQGATIKASLEAFALVHPQDAARHRALLEQAVRERGRYTSHFRIVRSDNGQIVWLEERGYAAAGVDGTTNLVGITMDITAQRDAEEARRALAGEREQLLVSERAARAEAERANRLKDEFIATLSHELRNPLAPVRQAAKILQAANVSASDSVWARGVIERQVQRMALLLDDLLDAARISRGKLELRKQTTELRAVIESAAETARPLIDAKGHELTLDLPAEAVCIEVDALRLSQVLANLLTNAAKYTDAGGTIRLAAAREGAAVIVRVLDNGIGISAELLPRIFEMFSQGTTALDRTEGGLGIGLSLVRGLVELHGGTVDARSEGLGRGSEFVVRIPLGAVQQAPALIATKFGTSHRAVPLKVLVADDNRDAAHGLGLLLELEGHEVRIAVDGRQALDTAAEFHPDVVLLDIGMPKMNGYEVAQQIRGQLWGQNTRLFALTGFAQDDDKRRALAAGFDQHLTKPVDPHVLLELLAR